ncbi:uncharacterized protein [Aquarana catesbeiana]|uniref:uncharacterized protein n=1 Tax=Aquarana catesbeiana TaxID=8400 RepID=UPI003CC98A7F
MKVILLFALFGLSFGGDGDNVDGTNCPKNPNVDDPNCLALALKELGDLFPAVGKYVCAYNKYKGEQNAENYNMGAQDLFDLLKCVSCKDFKLGDLLVKGGQTGSEALKAGILILQALGIDETTAHLICTLAGGSLLSDCLRNVFQNIAPNLLADLTKIYCEGTKNGATDEDAKAAAASAAAGIAKIPFIVTCFSGEQSGLIDAASLENSLKSLDPKLTLELLEKILLLTGEVKLVNGVICMAANPLQIL